MAVRPPRPAPSLALLAGAALIVVAGAARAAPGAAGPASGAVPGQAQPHTVYLPALAHRWTWQTASLGDPYSPGLGNPGYDVISYGIEVTFAKVPAPSATPYEARTSIRLRVTDPELADLSFDLHDAVVTGVEFEGAPIDWHTGPGKLWLPRPAGLREDLVFLVHHSGTAATTRVGTADGLARLGPDATRAWFPSNLHPGDRATFHITVTNPAPYVAAATGGFLTDDLADGVRRAEFGGGPPDLAPGEATVWVGPFQVVERQLQSGLHARHYLLRSPAEADAMLRAFEEVANYLVLVSKFRSFGVVETGLSTGIRPVSGLLLLGRTTTTQRPVALERSIGYPVARLIYGSAIGVKSNRDDWLNHGLAEYLNLQYAGRDQGPEPEHARYAAHEWNFSYLVGRDLPLTEIPADGSGANVQSYKAPWAIRMLAETVGQDEFDMALQYYASNMPFGGTADLAALQDAFEHVTGRPLGPLFDRLFRQATTPRANLAWAYSGSTLRFRVCQFTPQPVAFTLPLAAHGAGPAVPASVDVPAQADSTFSLAVPGFVTAVTPDPDQVLLADITVVPSSGPEPLPCSALPIPPLPAAAPVNVDGVGAQGPAPLHAPELAADREDGAAAFADTPGYLGLLPEDAAPVPEAHLVPGEPSIGDDYFPTLGNSGYDVGHYLVRMRVEPDAGRIAADATLTITSTLAGLDRLSLDFLRVATNRGLEVRAVTVDDQPATFERPAETDKLWVNLPAPVDAGGVFRLNVRYDGSPTGDSGLTFGSPATAGGGPVVYAVNEPDGTRGWIPANDHPRDKATYRFELTVPRPYVAVANGVKVSETASGADTIAVFEMRQPMASYLAAIGVARYQLAEQVGPGGLPITHYVLNDPADALRVAGVTPDTLEVFARLVAPYPFDTYGHNAVTGFGGGMENQALTAIGHSALASRTPRNSHSLIAHEAAHQWFGDSLSPYTWADIWLNEGFATYLTELWRADDVGPEPLGWRMEALRYSVLAGGRDAPVGRPQGGDFFGTNTYQKGGWVLHMLREQLGEVAFWSGVREYYAAHRFGNVTTADLRQALEAASGQDLAPFFAQWVDRPGNPVVDLYWKWSPNRVDLRFCQAGTPFTLRLTPVVHWQGQNLSLRSPQPILLDGPEVTVGLDLPFRGVSGVTPDPDFATLADFRVHRVTGEELPPCGGS